MSTVYTLYIIYSIYRVGEEEWEQHIYCIEYRRVQYIIYSTYIEYRRGGMGATVCETSPPAAIMVPTGSVVV